MAVENPGALPPAAKAEVPVPAPIAPYLAVAILGAVDQIEPSNDSVTANAPLVPKTNEFVYAPFLDAPPKLLSLSKFPEDVQETPL